MKFNPLVNEKDLFHLMTGTIVFQSGVLIQAGWEIHKMRRMLKQWQKNHEYMKRLNVGLSDIACNPVADPVQNRAAVHALIDDINAEILLDQVDFGDIGEHLRDKE